MVNEQVLKAWTGAWPSVSTESESRNEGAAGSKILQWPASNPKPVGVNPKYPLRLV